MTESDEGKRRERKREIDIDRGEETADDEMTEKERLETKRNQQQAREKGEGTGELEFWMTSWIVRLWTRSLGRRSGKLVSGPMVGFRRGKRVRWHRETLERIERKTPE